MRPKYCSFLSYSRKCHMLMAAVFYGLVLLMTNLGTISAQEGETLVTIMSKWKGNLTWVAGSDHCIWTGIICDAQRNTISLGQYLLTIQERDPYWLYQLYDLWPLGFYRNLSSTGISGPVPEEIGTLKHLIYLDLSKNDIKGDLAPLASLTNLQVLNMSTNTMGGEFPYAVLKLTQLVDLRLDNLYLTGPFPTEWRGLKNLQYLYLGNSKMTGTFPTQLTELSNLKELTLWNNTLNSRLPPELGSLSRLTYFNVHHCSMWGPLPPEFSRLQSMERLYLYNNYFTGMVPDRWKNMTNLKDLRLQNNFLTGKEFPAWIPNHPKLSQLRLSYNQLYAPFPNLTNSNFSVARLECCFYKGPLPVIPPLIKDFFYKGNCFDGQTVEDGATICNRVISCDGFKKRLDQYGCPLCPSGQISLNASACICGLEEGSGSSKSMKTYVQIITPIAVGLVLALVISLFLLSRSGSRRRFHSFFALKNDDGDWDAPPGVQRFRIEDLAKATNNFHVDNEIGSGGFGKVFVGTLASGKKLAIKRASIASLQGSTEFRNEVVLLSRLHHRNLVRLEGFCEDDGLRILVYEFMSNGNLHTWLFPKKENRYAIHWYKRLEISLEIAQGLDYLHSFADPPVIHRDIKPSNVLLDDNLVAKLADFGLSKATPEFETHLSTSPAGTAGFIDPQYFLRQQLTTASDVYGFGVVLLELVTGQKAIDQLRKEETNLVEWVKLMMKAEGIRTIVDPYLGQDYPEKLFAELVGLALKCSSFERELRPAMKEIVSFLEYLIQSAPPEQKVSGSSKEETFDMDHCKTAADTSIRTDYSDPASFPAMGTAKNGNFQLQPR